MPRLPRLPLHPASGSGLATNVGLAIRFVRYGCTNRPFYHIVVMNAKLHQRRPPIEQLGTYDPLPNKHNEKLCAINIERIQHWIGVGADVTTPVSQLLGLAGLLPLHPRTYISAWRNRIADANVAMKDTDKTQQKLRGLSAY